MSILHKCILIDYFYIYYKLNVSILGTERKRKKKIEYSDVELGTWRSLSSSLTHVGREEIPEIVGVYIEEIDHSVVW